MSRRDLVRRQVDFRVRLEGGTAGRGLYPTATRVSTDKHDKYTVGVPDAQRGQGRD